MKKLILLLFCLCAYVNNVHADNVSHYVEFVRTYGIVRYFSPNPYTQDWSESDWMKVCALLVNRAETQPLETVFKPLAPILSFSTAPVTSEKDVIDSSSPAWYYYYSGSGELNVPFLAKLFMPGIADYIPYYKKLSVVSDNNDPVVVPVANKYYSYKVSDGKYLNIQHALPKEMFDKKETHSLLTDAKNYWKNHKSSDKSLSKRRRFIFGLLSDRAVRVADMTVRWNIIRHFYPYYEEDNLDWDNQLEVYLRKVVRMGNMDTFESLIGWHNTICRFLNPIKDGHLFVRKDMNISGIMSAYLPEKLKQSL